MPRPGSCLELGEHTGPVLKGRDHLPRGPGKYLRQLSEDAFWFVRRS